jgi:hypothetical protein
MKFIEFGSLLAGPQAELALFSTYQFDPDYFERRILATPALQKARRIAVFMDARQWFALLREDHPARLLNRRYLVVPVFRSGGVFHPKLTLLATNDGARVLCGSNNLTRAGCSSNLEILNSLQFPNEEDEYDSRQLARDALEFFSMASKDADDSLGKLVRGWMEEFADTATWTAPARPAGKRQRARLLHTYSGPIWRTLGNLLQDPPKRLMVVSPFYDQDCELILRTSQRWPKCKIELVVQQHTTTLDVGALEALRGRIQLAELQSSVRRLHAKLIVWQTASGTGCIAGSANFTCAAFDARNVEACLLINQPEAEVAALFGSGLEKHALDYGDFEPGTENDQDSSSEMPPLRLDAAILDEGNVLRITYRHNNSPGSRELQLGLRTPGEQKPRALLPLPASGTKAEIELPEAALSDSHGTLLAFLIAKVGAETVESVPVWVVQKSRLTYEQSGEISSSGGSKIEETGEGLVEFLHELGEREGIAAVIEYLKNLNIRFNDGGSGKRSFRPFRLRIQDPYRGETLPGWLLEQAPDGSSLASTICDFADRHENQKLRKHAQRGNINGIENYLSILFGIVRVLFVYYLRGVVSRQELLSRLYRYLKISTEGIYEEDDECPGYLFEIHENLAGESAYLAEADEDIHLVAHVWAVYFLARHARMADAAVLKQPEYLPALVATLRDLPSKLKLKAPRADDISEILKQYAVLENPVIEQLVAAY